MSELPEITVDELQERLFFAISRAAGRLARIFEFSLDDAREWFEVAYYDVLSDEGHSQSESAEILGVSTRKVVQLAGMLKRNFYDPERHGGLDRHIEFMLWAGRMSEGRIRQTLRDVEADEVRAVLDRLVEEGRIERIPGRTTYYEIPDDDFQLFRDDWVSRISALDNHLENVVNVVYARFVDESDRAFARTITFECREEDLEELRELYRDIVFPKLQELEFKLDKDPDSDPESDGVEMRLTLNWAPNDYCDRTIESSSGRKS